MTVAPEPDAFAQVVFTDHADERLREPDRGGTDDLDWARGEIRDAIVCDRVEWRGRNIWYLHAGDGRVYVIARERDGTLIVITVLPDQRGCAQAA